MTARCEDEPRQSLFVLTVRQLPSPIYRLIRPRFDGRLADEKYGAAAGGAHILRRREIRNNSGLKYNECDLKYITSATFPSRPRAHLFRLFCSCRAAAAPAHPITSRRPLLINNVVWIGNCGNNNATSAASSAHPPVDPRPRRIPRRCVRRRGGRSGARGIRMRSWLASSAAMQRPALIGVGDAAWRRPTTAHPSLIVAVAPLTIHYNTDQPFRWCLSLCCWDVRLHLSKLSLRPWKQSSVSNESVLGKVSASGYANCLISWWSPGRGAVF